jgi:exonuclease SbcD
MVKILHTSDWHVGKAIRGNSRADEHRAVLAEITTIADEHQVDLVVVAGDLFETAAPSPESEEIVYRALLQLADTGATVAVVSGNHDNAHRLRAVAPLFERGRVHLLTEPKRPDTGGVRRLSLRSGEDLSVAMLPFVSQRGIVKAENLMADAGFEHAQLYADRMRGLIERLCGELDPALPGLLVTHAFVYGGQIGGGERMAHLATEYAVVTQSFPANVGYVALGHLHRAQKLPGATAIHYCGSPLQLDFGETNEAKQVNLVDLSAGKPAKVTPVELSSGSLLFTLSGTVHQIADAASSIPDNAWIRARVDEPRRAGLADELRERLGDMGPRLVDVLITTAADPKAAKSRAQEGRSPHELFADFLASRNVDDPRLTVLFDELLEASHEDESEPAT